jgi:hypothetical protein
MNCLSFKQNISNINFKILNCKYKFLNININVNFKLNCYNKSHPKYFKLLEFYSDLSLGK